MHPNDIQASVKKAGFSASAIAREFDVSHVSVVRVIQGVSRSQRIEERVSEVTDIPLYRLWPEWYEAPAGVQGDLPMGGIDLQLLEAVERNFEAELLRRVPKIRLPIRVKGRHRVAVYNAAIKAGPSATETVAGVANQVVEYLDKFVEMHGEDYEPAAMVKWAVFDDESRDESRRKSAAERTVINSPGAKVGRQVNLTGDGQSIVMGNKIKKQKISKK